MGSDRNYHHHYVFYSPYVSSAQRLPNGNTLICEGDCRRIFEATSDHETVWEYVLPPNIDENYSYRAYRVPYDWVPQRLACTLLVFALIIAALYRPSDFEVPRTSPTDEFAKSVPLSSTRTAQSAPGRSTEQLAEEIESIARGFGTRDNMRGAISISTEPKGARIIIDDAFIRDRLQGGD